MNGEDPMMRDFFRLVAFLACLVFAAAAITAALGCDRPAPPSPPFEHGVCEPAEYARGKITAWRCEYAGNVWWCQGSVCTLALPVSRAPR